MARLNPVAWATAIVLLSFAACPCFGFSFLLGAIRCTQGPNYWCHDVDTAKECNAEKYCAEKVWQPEQTFHRIKKNDAGDVISDSSALVHIQRIIQIQRIDNPDDRAQDDVCDMCVNVVETLEDKALGPENEAKVKAALEAICDRLGPLSGECKAAVDMYVPQMFAALKKIAGNPKAFCAAYGLCPPPKEDLLNILTGMPLMDKVAKDQVASTACSSCSSGAHFLKGLLHLPGFAEELPNALCKLAGDENSEDCLEMTSNLVEIFHEHMDPALACASSFCPNARADFLLEEKEDEVMEEEKENTKDPSTTEAPTTPPPPPLPRVCKMCIRKTRWVLRKMERKLWRDKRRWLWGCKFALNTTKCQDAVDNMFKHAEEALKKTCPYKTCAFFGYCPTKKNGTSEVLPASEDGFVVEEIDVIIVDMGASPDRQEAAPSSKEAVPSHDKVSFLPMLEVDPAAILKAVQMTEVKTEAHLLKKAHLETEEKVNLDVCTYCEEIVNYAKILLGSPDAEAQIKVLLEGMCDNLGPFKEVCTKMVDQDLDQIIEKLKHLDTKQVCVDLHLCSASSAQFHRLLSAVTASSACASCKSFVNGAVLPSIQMIGAEEDFAVGFCHVLGLDDLACHKRMSNYLSVAKVYGNADRLCTAVCHHGIGEDFDQCLAAAEPENHESVGTKSTTPAPMTTEAPTVAPPPQPPACAKCLDVLAKIKARLTGKLSCLESRLNKSCQIFPPLAIECQAAVEGFFKPINEKLAKLSVKDVCIKMGVCIPFAEQARLEAAQKLGVKGGRAEHLAAIFGNFGPVDFRPDAKEGKPLEDPFIGIGVMGANRPQFTVQSDAAKEPIEESKIHVGGHVKAPQTEHIKLHRSDSNVMVLQRESGRDDAAVCSFCMFIGEEAKKVLTSTTTQEQIKALIMAGCAELPTKPRDECMTFMSTHSKNLLDMLLKEYTPLKACAIMKACHPGEVNSGLKANSLECYACKFAGQEVKDLWKNPHVSQTVNNTLHSVCLKLPLSMQPACMGEVDTLFPIISAMVTQMDPADVCASIGLCEAQSVKHLLGADECTWGPAHWCSDWKVAKKCRQIDHCKKNVWNHN